MPEPDASSQAPDLPEPPNALDHAGRELLALARPDLASDLPTSQARTSLVERPETSVAQTSIFTGTKHEPALGLELQRELASADEFDMLVSFIRWTGFSIIRKQLEDFCQRGGRLRVITTTYIGATDAKAVDQLAKLPGAQVRVTYDTAHKRLHAKAYIFRRATGFSTAYVGSSNLSRSAITTGTEWNVKIAAKELPDTMAKISATFDTYWQDESFEPYDGSEGAHRRLVAALRKESGSRDDHATPEDAPSYLFDIRPYTFQKRILEKLVAEREVGNHWRNLVVAATGTGKTVICALDYRDFCRRYFKGEQASFLFVVHREEILRQALGCFRGVLRDANFGSMLAGGVRPASVDGYRHLFCTIQSFESQRLAEHLPADFYDYIVVDEFHHAAAKSYQDLLSHFVPKVLLGLTATPERMDGRSILPWFDDRIAAEIRLPEAIDMGLLCPFHYFGVSDEASLKDLEWSAGGYRDSDLNNVYVFSASMAKRRAQAIAQAVRNYLPSIEGAKGLGFCVSKEHAEFMADQFNRMGIPSTSVTDQTPAQVRSAVPRQLREGRYKFVFVVNVYNEGVDIAEVNTVLFLRPTKSLTIFLQQLGRGLRLCEGKECLTVLDFIGQANQHYDFAQKFQALLEHSHRSVDREVRDGFVSLPQGCYVQLEPKAQEYVLDNIDASLRGLSAYRFRLQTFRQDSGRPLTLGGFLDYYDIDPCAFYARRVTAVLGEDRQRRQVAASFSRLCVGADVREDFDDPDEREVAAALGRIAQIDSRRWIDYLLRAIPHADALVWEETPEIERLMLSMFEVTVWPGAIDQGRFANGAQALRRLARNKVLTGEICELLAWRRGRIDFVDEPVDIGHPCPLDLHCHYTTAQVLAALGDPAPNSLREGVKQVPGRRLDILLNTLMKSEKDYSPSTMYEDYSISPTLFHWQSQSRTSEESPTGQRYIHHRERDWQILLFCREHKKDRYGLTEAYCFLGKVGYVQHEGSRPMSIIWRLERPIPAKLLPETSKLAAVG